MCFRTHELYCVQRRSWILRNKPRERRHCTIMNTSQLQCIISCDPVLHKQTVGVFAADQLPCVLPNMACGFIANTDVSSRPGQHWLAFFISDNTVECFDSYGQDPGVYNSLFSLWLRRHAKTVRVNRHRLQSENSNVCGLYCLYFLRQRFLGKCMETIVQPFTESAPVVNDQYMKDLFWRVYPLCVRNDFVYNQSCKPRCDEFSN